MMSKKLYEAWYNEGPHPELHHAAKRKLKEFWPALYNALDTYGHDMQPGYWGPDVMVVTFEYHTNEQKVVMLRKGFAREMVQYTHEEAVERALGDAFQLVKQEISDL